LCHIQIFLCLWAVGKPTHCSFIVAWPFLCHFVNWVQLLRVLEQSADFGMIPHK
jgi:hypothetical protein